MSTRKQGTRYPEELRRRAVRMVFDHQGEYSSQWKAVCAIAEQLGVHKESLRVWVRSAETDAGTRPGVSSEERERIKQLERESRELRPPSEPAHLESGRVFLRGGARPPVQEVVAFIDANRDRWGVEPICRVLQFAPSTYYAARSRPPSARAQRDEVLKPLVVECRRSNLDVYGADKVWDQLNKDGVRVARCTVERLMRELGLAGARRGRAFVVTTDSDHELQRPADLVSRAFAAPAPNRLWVADLTYVKTHSGWVYVAFIIDVFSRMIVGWQASRSLRSNLAIDALEMAMWQRRRAGPDLDGLIHHSDRGVQYLSIRYADRLADNEIVASVESMGTVGDSYDCERYGRVLLRQLQTRRRRRGALRDPRRSQGRDLRLVRLVTICG